MKIFRLGVCLIFVLMFNTAWSMVPPKYLSVPHWKECTSSETKGGAEFYCLPGKKPLLCPKESWKKLTKEKMMDRCS